MLLNKVSLNVAKFASTEESRYALKNIEVTGKRVTAITGHYLASVTNTNFEDSSFPVTDGLQPVPDGRYLVSAESALEAAKALPKKPTIPVLGCAALSANAMLYVNNLESVKAIDTKPESGTFPTWEAIVSKKKPQAQIVVNAAYLEKITQFIRQHSENELSQVRMTIYGNNEAMRLDAAVGNGQEAMFLLMPIRLDSCEFVKLPHEQKPESKPVAA